MFKKINILIISIFIFTVISCDKNSSNLKTIQQQKAGDVIISILNDAGSIKKGSDKFYIEFRNATDNQLIDAGSVKANAVMQMSGMPMSGDISVSPTNQAGRYEAKYNFSMSGTWILEINFNNDKKTQFSLTVN